MLLFRGRTIHFRGVQEGLRRNSVSRIPSRCDSPAYVSLAQRVLCPFLSLPGSTRWNPLVPLQRQGSTPSLASGSLRRFPQIQREFPPRSRVSVSFLYLDPLSPFRTPMCS